ncbi:GNAT family N-acetyltransferase [Altererythrobacter confluentis]|uniref:GNAT family N-acetyltransferase n=1 Tax=Allopontixanthobacter confluentis TaxID=1849021 RepID=A0A6L7GBQ9_9SPHN|nr:GNAT family N-acetyltransferase [Allopontixanthobacter confluentis]MXP13327.1 GNAT family N-acetyltransferase [Allopontixanthobacter confluentis]
MAITFEIVSFGTEIKAAYANLFGGEKSPEMLKWRFEDNPHGRGKFAIAREGDNIIGMIALISTRFSFGGRTYTGIQAVDTIVAPEARGKALFVRMGKAIYEHADELNADLLWGFPNAQAARGWFGRLGWTRFGMVPFVVRPLRTGYVLRRVAPILAKIDLPLAKSKPKNEDSIREVIRFGGDSLEMCERFNAETACALDYSPEFLNWRFIDCPQTNYRSVGEYGPDGKMRAMVSGIILEKHNARIFYLMEAMSSRAHAPQLRKLVKHELSFAVGKGAEIALAWNSRTSPNGKALKHNGFLPLPERLRPVEIHFGAKPLRENVPEELLNGDNWNLSYATSDTV